MMDRVVFKLKELDGVRSKKALYELVKKKTVERLNEFATDKLIAEVLAEVNKGLAVPERPSNVQVLEIYMKAPVAAKVTHFSYAQEVCV